MKKVETKACNGYIYLLHEREFIDKQEDVYKIGMTSQPNQKRFRGYPKGSRVLYQIDCPNYKRVEKILIENFKEMFTQMKEIGTEYFKGDKRKMLRVIYSVIDDEDSANESETIKKSGKSTLQKKNPKR